MIENGVYDVSKWVTRHQGGLEVLSAGEDVTMSFLGHLSLGFGSWKSGRRRF